MAHAIRALALGFASAATLGLLGCQLAWAASAKAAVHVRGSDSESAHQGEPPIAVPEPSPRAIEFHNSGNVLWLIGQVWAIAVPAIFFLSGASAWLELFTKRIGRRWIVSGALYVLVFVALTALLRLPLAYYAGFVRLHNYELSRQSLGDWLSDELTQWLVVAAFAVPLAICVYAVISKYPRSWWIGCGLAAAPLLVFLAMIKPLWIDPLFNHFGPMQNKALEARILALARRAGIDADRVYQVDMSRKTTLVNAYVTGLGSTQRIVLWDTLIEELGPEQVLSVMGHEMGHFALGHVGQGVLLGSVCVLVGLGLIRLAAGGLLLATARRSHVYRLKDFASLPLLVALGYAANLAITPVAFAFSRHFEWEADRFCLELTRDNRAAASAFVTMMRENLLLPRPSPFYKLWRATHPSVGERIDFCNNYRPWAEGKPLRYESRVRPDEPR